MEVISGLLSSITTHLSHLRHMELNYTTPLLTCCRVDRLPFYLIAYTYPFFCFS